MDCGSLNFGEGSQLYISTPDMLRAGAARIQELGVKPEMEIFDTGQLWFAMVNMLPAGANWASFAIGRNQMPWVAQSVILGGHVRVGLEDNLYLSKGVKATNAQLVERAVTIVEALGATIATPDQAREKLGLKRRA